MKFGRILMMLMSLIEQTLPEWKDQFLSYKDLKKQLNKPNNISHFVNLLELEIDKFNAFFLDKVEDFIINLKVLRDSVAEIRSSEELMRVGTDLADLHGQMVLLVNYSELNYTGLKKILKKYDKRTGAFIRSPVIQKVLEEPFFRTDVLNKLIKECETILGKLFPRNEQSKAPGGEGSRRESTSGVGDAEVIAEIKEPSKEPGEGSSSSRGSEGGSGSTKIQQELAETENPSIAPGVEESSIGRSSGVRNLEELAEIDDMGNMYVKLTKSALRVLQEIRSGSSTISMFSLPPLGHTELHEF